MPTTGPIEEELKIPVHDLEAVRSRVRARGATLQVPRQLEDNAVLDTPGLSLLGSGRLLRLRRWGDEVLLTFKGPARYDRGVKSRLELETRVDNSERMLGILAELGWTPQRRYQKWRDTWLVGEVTVAFDETPIGCFVELEGPGDALRAASDSIGLDPSTAIPASYQELWQRWRQTHPGAPRDMVFPGLE
ncbi:MAG TPA: class IV adenylate cyclase [Thermoanaerobaculaceae bacterium]|nr:class IV adenylate cyclase [Thermoanaerobaculaceae bacterium]HPS77873.1 class IV adenylate cyclase [Thermoanaerobaculaceae bacterium]